MQTRFRKIGTKIPSPETVKIIHEAEKYGLDLMSGQLPVAWDKAIDFNVFDKSGNKWIDFTSGIFLANAGHANPQIKKAIDSQLKADLLHAYNYPTEIKTRFLKKLISLSPKSCHKALLFATGAETTEASILMMRTHGQLKNKNKIGIISFRGSMHGATMGARMLQGNQKILDIYGFSDPNIFHLPFPYPWEAKSKNFDWTARFKNDLKELEKRGMKVKNLCGFMVESFQGWGALFYPQTYIKELAKFAEKNKILLAFDEIQSGCGRTGKMFAFEHYGVTPDLICLGKGLSSSLPLSAVVSRGEIIDLAEVADCAHSTHSGNPLSCAAGLANLEELQSKNLIKESERKGKILLAGLNELKNKFPDRISYVFGKGLLAAVLFKDPKTGEPEGEFPSRVCERAMQKGLLLVHTGRESIKIAPPLTIPNDALKEGVKVLEESIFEIEQETGK
ncbi:MAG: Aminotransferase class-III [Parcubacteria group bacterium Gr01-1014_44]|nr:MAG: Aminotransferase class-III [Parcubacteria group bacterium Gr01-1014_44]